MNNEAALVWDCPFYYYYQKQYRQKQQRRVVVMKAGRKVLVGIYQCQGESGYDIAINDREATVQDYLDALNKAIAELPLTRARAQRSACAGCDLCCAERAPLTWIDILQLSVGKRDFSLGGLLRKVAYIVVDGPVVDIMLRRGKDGKCIFLDRTSRLCGIYSRRPLVCQVFICAPATGRARRLWEITVNKGEDELVRRWLGEALTKGYTPCFDEGYNPCPRLEDWVPTPYTGKTSYREVAIKELVPRGLWKQLTKPLQKC